MGHGERLSETELEKTDEEKVKDSEERGKTLFSCKGKIGAVNGVQYLTNLMDLMAVAEFQLLLNSLTRSSDSGQG